MPQPELKLIVQPPAEFKTTLQVGQGPAGPSGGGTLPPFYFLTALDIWIINHNLGRRPNTSVYSVGGVEMLAEIIQISNNQVQIFFDQPTAGYAICS